MKIQAATAIDSIFPQNGIPDHIWMLAQKTHFLI
jgi:hypothetical protein